MQNMTKILEIYNEQLFNFIWIVNDAKLSNQIIFNRVYWKIDVIYIVV